MWGVKEVSVADPIADASLAESSEDALTRQPSLAARSFFVWGVGGYVVTTAVLLLASLRVSHWKLVYLIDDPAIHLSMARTLAESGTWGVVPGHFQSASSSPLWTVALAVAWRIWPSGAMWAPIVFNVAASVVVIWLIGANQDVLRPNREHPLDGLAVVALVVAVLFLPALTLLGMEHVLHMALTLAIVYAFARRAEEPKSWPGWLLVALIAAASLVRFETAFIAIGLAVATFVGPARVHWRVRVVRAGTLLAASAVPIVAFAGVNRLAGQGWLPNSVLAKGQVVGNGADSSLDALNIFNRLTTDPLLAFLFVVSCVVVVAGWRRTKVAVTAIAFAVTCMLHVVFAQIGWFERYQAYLVAFGLAVLLQLGTELQIRDRWASGMARSYRVGLATLLLLTLCATKISLTVEVPNGVADTYQQRYQAARFLQRYYDGKPIATGELGYISLLHRGPITDLLGLGDYQVLELRRSYGQNVPPAVWSQLAKQRGFDVVAVYPYTLFFNTPKDWILVGTLKMSHHIVTAYENQFQFWATTPEAVAPLERQLRAFEPSLPAGVELQINPFANLRASRLAKQGS